MIVVKNLKRPGVTYDSTKLAVLGNKISGSIQSSSKGRYIAKSTVSGNAMKLTVKELNPETKKYVATQKNEQTLLAGRISSFLHQQGITADVVVT